MENLIFLKIPGMSRTFLAGSKIRATSYSTVLTNDLYNRVPAKAISVFLGTENNNHVFQTCWYPFFFCLCRQYLPKKEFPIIPWYTNYISIGIPCFFYIFTTAASNHSFYINK